MEKRNGVPFWMSAVMFVLCVFAIAGNVYSVIRGQLDAIVNALSGVVALIYCFLGYKKKGAILFKAYCWFLFISIIVVMFANRALFAEDSVSSTVFFLYMLTNFTCFCILAFGKDLGRTKSMALAYTLLAVRVAVAIIGCFATLPLMERIIAPVLMSVVLCIMVYGKYMDKAARGTK